MPLRRVRQTIPGWPYSMVVALESGRSSWTAPLDVVRVGPGDDVTEVTAAQIREVTGRLRAAGQWSEGDPPVLIVTDAGYDVVRLAWLLADLPVQLLGRVRTDRVFYAPAGGYAGTGRPARHGQPVKLSDPITRPVPDQTATSVSDRYGNVAVHAYARRHQRLRECWVTERLRDVPGCGKPVVARYCGVSTRRERVIPAKIACLWTTSIVAGMTPAETTRAR
jgi:hypothetical protein